MPICSREAKTSLPSFRIAAHQPLRSGTLSRPDTRALGLARRTHLSSSTRSHGLMIGKALPDARAETIAFYRQIGAEAVAIPPSLAGVGAVRPLVPPKDAGVFRPQPAPWRLAEIRKVMQAAQENGLVVWQLGLPVSRRVVCGRQESAQDLASILECIRVAGQAGIRVLTYNWTPLRASEGYGRLRGAGRGGADLRDFCSSRLEGLLPLADVGTIGLEELWGNLHAFLLAVVPAAERAGIRLAVHPSDPPVSTFRGVAQPLATLVQWRQLLSLVDDSASNCLYFDTGVATEIGADAVAGIREFGGADRIAAVHFRNVRVLELRKRYLETFLDEGDCDMVGCMRALCDVGFEGIVDPDHTPLISADDAEAHAGWAFAVGYMLALRAASLP